MNNFKRLLLVFPLSLVLLLGLVAPVKALAVADDSLFYDYSIFDRTLSNFFVLKHSSGSTAWTYGIFLDEGFYDVSESNGIYTVTCSANHDVRPLYIFRSSGSDARYARESDQIHSFVWNESTLELICYRSNGNESLHITNTSDNPVIDFDYDLWSNDALNVSVVFQPSLSGTIDRTVTDTNGASGLSQGFTMTVTNNGRTGIQYRMAIFEGSSTFAFPSGGIYGESDSCVYAYITNQWVMAADISSMRHLYTYETATKQHKACNWHFLDSGGEDVQVFKYSQINFKPNTDYTVIVEAVPNSSGTTSIYFSGNTVVRGDGAHAMDPSFEQYILSNDDIEQVYRSTFSISYLGDVTYNPNDTSNGIIPNSSHEDYARAINTRDAFENPDGSIDYASYNAYDDPNSWINDPKIKSSEEWQALGNVIYDDGITSLSYSSFGSGTFFPSSVQSLGNGISNFGSFIASILGLFPPVVLSVISLGILSVVIIGIIKAVK